jgi:hypothetical protein
MVQASRQRQSAETYYPNSKVVGRRGKFDAQKLIDAMMEKDAIREKFFVLLRAGRMHRLRENATGRRFAPHQNSVSTIKDTYYSFKFTPSSPRDG